MSQPFLQQQQQQQPPPVAVTQQPHAAHYTGTGSVGPVIGVLAVVMILGAIAGVIGRLCAGSRIFGYGGQYDVEGWVEAKCASCIDGRMDPPPPRVPIVNSGGGGGGGPVPIAIPVETPKHSGQSGQSRSAPPDS